MCVDAYRQDRRSRAGAGPALWEGVGMRVEEMDAEVHDSILAQVSHLPISSRLVYKMDSCRRFRTRPGHRQNSLIRLCMRAVRLLT